MIEIVIAALVIWWIVGAILSIWR